MSESYTATTPSTVSVMAVPLQQTFLSLPAEIRDQIYAHLLVEQLRELDEDRLTYTYPLSIFRVNKQIYAEASRIFRLKNIFIRIETPWDQAEHHVAVEGRVPLLCIGPAAETFQTWHMRVAIEAPEMQHTGLMSKFVVRLEDLDKFCKMWFYSDLTHIGLNNHLAVRLILNDTSKIFPDRKQQDCLGISRSIQAQLFLPFGQVKGLYSVKFEGKYDSTIETATLLAMGTPYDSPERCLETSAKYKDQGNEALKQGQYSLALDCYQKAFHAIHILVDGRRRRICGDAYFEKDLHGGIYEGEHGGIMRMIMRIRLVANTILAYLKLERWEDAEFWGMRSINLMREALGGTADVPRPAFPASHEWGKIYYRTALACKHMGEMQEARELLRIAGQWLPSDRIVQQEIAACALRLG